MNLLNQFESEQRILSELKSMFEFAPPAHLRRSIEDLFFIYLSIDEEIHINKQLTEHVYFLINFLNEVENVGRK